MNKKPQQLTGADETRAALVRAALRLFGSQGYAATSTREIASAANANIGSIAYHFGGKDGLRQAAADHIVTTIRALAAQAIAAPTDNLSPAQARAMMHGTLRTMLTFIAVRPEAGDLVQFVLRELANPTAALDSIYQGVFEPTHKRFCALWETATGEPADSDRVKLTVFTLIGQVVYFRIGREAILRRMAWRDIGAAQAEDIVTVAIRNLDAILDSARSTHP